MTTTSDAEYGAKPVLLKDLKWKVLFTPDRPGIEPDLGVELRRPNGGRVRLTIWNDGDRWVKVYDPGVSDAVHSHKWLDVLEQQALLIHYLAE